MLRAFFGVGLSAILLSSAGIHLSCSIYVLTELWQTGLNGVEWVADLWTEQATRLRGETALMPIMVDVPTIVQDAVEGVGDLCANAPARRHCAEDRTGLRVAAQQTVSGLHGAWVVTTDPSGVHRWLHEVPWDVQALNDRRVAWWQGDPKTRDSPRGVRALDKTLGDQAGTLSADVGWCWDQAHERSGLAHDALLSHAVCPSGAHAPSAGRRVRKKDACHTGECTDHPAWGLAGINEALARGIPGDGTVDRSCTRAQVRHHLQRPTRASGGT